MSVTNCYVRFGIDKKPGILGFLQNATYFVYIEPATEAEYQWLVPIYKNKVVFSKGTMGYREGYPGLTIFFHLGVTENFSIPISDINLHLQRNGWNKYSESRSFPHVGEMSFRK